MRLQCPECGETHDLDGVVRGQKVECSCSHKFFIDDRNILDSGSDEKNPEVSLENDNPQRKTMHLLDQQDFSRTICVRCGKRINTEKLSPGKEFECPFCKTSNIVGQNRQSVIDLNDQVTAASISDGGHAYSTCENPDDNLPEIIGRCKIEKLIGEGGMGRVYLAKHLTLNIPVALKTMHAGFSTFQSYSERFIREAQTAAKMNHPNVVRIYDC